jgi:hypothetical protein
MSSAFAHQFRITKTQIDDLRLAAKPLIGEIKQQVKDAHEKGLKAIDFNLPMKFDIVNMKPKDAVQIVHSLIIEDLSAPHNDLTVRLSQDRTKIMVTWLSRFDEAILQHSAFVCDYFSKPIDQRDQKKPNLLSIDERLATFLPRQ